VLALSLLALVAAEAPPASSLETLVRVAAVDSHRQKPEDRPFIRYLSLHAVDEPDRSDFNKADSLAVNGAQFGGDLVKLKVFAGGRLVRIDLRSLRWDRYSREVALEDIARLGIDSFKTCNKSFVDIWEGISGGEPFFDLDLLNVDPAMVEQFRLESQSYTPILSAHWLYPRLLLEPQDGGFYSHLLLNPPKKADLERRWGVFRQFVDVDPRAKHGAAVVKSASVAYNPREILLLQSSIGFDEFHHWTTSDFDLSRVRKLKEEEIKAKDVRESPANTTKPDGQETIFSLPDGLHGYFLNNAAGDQVSVVPQQIAEDQRPHKDGVAYSQTKSVINPFKCLDCHGESRGIIGFDDNILKLIVAEPRQDTRYAVVAVDLHGKKDAVREAQRIEEFYRKGLIQKAEQHRVSYDARVRECTGLDTFAATRLLVKFYDRYTAAYASELVSLDQAAREIGYPPPLARVLFKAARDNHDYRRPNNQLGFLAAGQPITRIQWELNARAAFKVAAQPLRKKAG
jgi:hypothetical protein